MCVSCNPLSCLPRHVPASFQSSFICNFIFQLHLHLHLQLHLHLHPLTIFHLPCFASLQSSYSINRFPVPNPTSRIASLTSRAQDQNLSATVGITSSLSSVTRRPMTWIFCCFWQMVCGLHKPCLCNMMVSCYTHTRRYTEHTITGPLISLVASNVWLQTPLWRNQAS